MKAEVKNFVKECTGCSSTVLVVLSHGGPDVVFGADGQCLSIMKDLVYLFHRDSAPHLVDKPKLFIFQACRGGNVSSAWFSLCIFCTAL